jgi:hypothetical protein
LLKNRLPLLKSKEKYFAGKKYLLPISYRYYRIILRIYFEKKIFILLFILLAVFSCKKNIEENDLKEKIIKLSANNEIKQLLEYPIKSIESPSKKYIFVYAKGVEPLKDILMKNVLKKDFNIDGFTFNKNDNKWWFVFDTSLKKIILNGKKLVLFNDKPIWDENNNILILMTTLSDNRDLLFFNKESQEMIDCYYKDNNSYSIINNKYIAYQYILKTDEESTATLEIGIKIKNLETNKDAIIINPSNVHGKLEIVKWESENKLIYKEVDRGKNILEEKSYEINKF